MNNDVNDPHDKKLCNVLVILMHFLKFLVILLAVLLLGCNAESYKVSSTGYTKSLRFERITIGQSGIIGDYQFYIDPPEHLNTAFKATGSLGVYGEDKKVVSLGVGLHIQDLMSKKEFILTARHLIYDNKSSKKLGNLLFFGYKNDSQPNVWINLERFHLKDKYKFKHINDWILIPIESMIGREPFKVNLRASHFFVDPPDFHEKAGYLVSISSLLTDDESTVIRFIQKGSQLFYSEYLFRRRFISDFDAINGMSGSPIFYTDGKRVQLLGVMSSRSNVQSCHDIQSNVLCGSGAALINFSALR